MLVRLVPRRDFKRRSIGEDEVFSENSQKTVYLEMIKGLEVEKQRCIEMIVPIDEMKWEGWDFGILFIDIQYFKNINDF